MEAQQEKEGLSTLFKIQVAEMPEMVFRSCQGLEAEIEVLHYPEAGRLSAPRTARGLQRTQKISFSQGALVQGDKNANMSLFNWFKEVCDAGKPLKKKRIYLKLTDREGKALSEWEIKDAWPCRWVAPLVTSESTQLAIEVISFAHEGIERKS